MAVSTRMVREGWTTACGTEVGADGADALGDDDGRSIVGEEMGRAASAAARGGGETERGACECGGGEGVEYVGSEGRGIGDGVVVSCREVKATLERAPTS